MLVFTFVLYYKNNQNMKKLITISALIFVSYLTYAQNIVFKDSLFLKTILRNSNYPRVDSDGDGQISITEANNCTSLNLSRVYNLSIFTDTIQFDDIVHFKNVSSIYLDGIYNKRLDFSKISSIKYFKCENIRFLSSLNLDNNVNLKNLYVRTGAPLLPLDFTKFTELDTLIYETYDIYDYYKKIDLSKNIKLKYLVLRNRILAKTNFTLLPELETLYFQYCNDCKSIDLSKNIKLKYFGVKNTGDITRLDFRNNPLLNTVFISPDWDFGNSKNLQEICINRTNVITEITKPSWTTVNRDCTPLGIEEDELNKNFSLYPNPTKDVLNISVINPTASYTIQITNQLGQILYTNTLSNNSLQVNVNSIGANGLYFIKLIDLDNNVSVTRKLILE